MKRSTKVQLTLCLVCAVLGGLMAMAKPWTYGFPVPWVALVALVAAGGLFGWRLGYYCCPKGKRPK